MITAFMNTIKSPRTITKQRLGHHCGRIKEFFKRHYLASFNRRMKRYSKFLRMLCATLTLSFHRHLLDLKLLSINMKAMPI
ncbi:MAG: Putative transposase [Candidatus Midichloria mitochondrii]